MTRAQLENKGWRLYSRRGDSNGKRETYIKGNPDAENCIWLTRFSNSPKIEVSYSDRLVLEGWLVNCSAEDLHSILRWALKI